MNVQDEHIDSICTLLSHLIGNVSAKNLFTGYGLFYKKEIMFGIWVNKKIYLRAEGELADKLMKLGCQAFTTDEVNKRFILSDYYALSNKVLKDNNLCRTAIICSIQQIRDKQIAATLSRLNRLKDLPNFTIKQERALKKAGIEDVAMLRDIGAENAFISLRRAGIDATLEFYWKMAAGLQNKNSQLLSLKEKEVFLKKLNEALSANGYRRYRKLRDE